VPSIICKRSSAAPLPARAASTASNTPKSRQRANRRQTVFHLPYRSGIARQRAPSRARHRMPSRCRRLSCPGRPRPATSSGPASSHSVSVRSPRATPFPHCRKGGKTAEHYRSAVRPHGLAHPIGRQPRPGRLRAWPTSRQDRAGQSTRSRRPARSQPAGVDTRRTRACGNRPTGGRRTSSWSMSSASCTAPGAAAGRRTRCWSRRWSSGGARLHWVRRD
jgi:hypothetical protein